MQVFINGFSKEWRTSVQGITGQDQQLDWEHLWSDFTQEELRLSLVKGTIRNDSRELKAEKEEEENVALVSKGKAKKVPTQGQSLKGGEKKKKDISKVKCFACGEFVHYAM